MAGIKGKSGIYDHFKIRGKKKLPISAEVRAKISKNRKGKGMGNKNGLGKNLGNNNPNWKGGFNRIIYQAERYRRIKESLASRKRPDNCEICGAIGKVDFDHNHKTGKFRGWICRRCNLVLGLVKDNFEILIALSDYLKNDLFHNHSNGENSQTPKTD